MVGGLVEQQQVGVGEQQFGKFDTHSPAAGEFQCRAVEITACEAESEQCLLHFRLMILGLLNRYALGQLCHAVDQLLVGV